MLLTYSKQILGHHLTSLSWLESVHKFKKEKRKNFQEFINIRNHILIYELTAPK